MHIQVDNTNFSLCFVVTTGDTILLTISDPPLLCTNFIYHRLDIDTSQTACSYLNRMAGMGNQNYN